MTLDPTWPVTVATFFLGAILLVRFALPRWHAVKDLKRVVDAQSEALAKVASLYTDYASIQAALTQRVDDFETNIKTMHGNMVSIRDGVALRGALGRLSPGVSTK